MNKTNYKARILTRISEVSESAWDSHLPTTYHPFLSWKFLHTLEESGCVDETAGWAPRHIWLENEAGIALGAAPLYAKTHSQGEYVFDHAWADALSRVGENYYPKLQCSVPFTPVTGPRLLASTPEAKTGLVHAMLQACQDWDYSGVHLTFLQDQDRAALENIGFSIREDRQFHFQNPGYKNFDSFLDTLASRKRKNIRKERMLACEGLEIERLSGDDLKDHHWDIFYRCYLDTSARKWGRPYLNRAFFAQIHDNMRQDILLIIATENDIPVAAALNFIGADALYGRNWGALVHKPFLHFELCYYQAIEAAIERGLGRVEAGAQGEHKLARGYSPVTTTSAHYMIHPGLRAAVDDYLVQERQAVAQNIKILNQHTPFKKTDPA